MAISSIRIANAASGNRIQAIQAVETDSEGFATVMERVVSGSVKLPTTIGNAVRGQSAMISAADTLDLTALPTDLTGNLLTVGDGSLLIVFAEMTVNTGYVTVTPILFDSQSPATVLGPLQSRSFLCPYAFRRGSATGNYVSYVQFWDTVGAYKIGLHVSALSSSNTCKLYGYVI